GVGRKASGQWSVEPRRTGSRKFGRGRSRGGVETRSGERALTPLCRFEQRTCCCRNRSQLTGTETHPRCCTAVVAIPSPPDRREESTDGGTGREPLQAGSPRAF